MEWTQNDYRNQNECNNFVKVLSVLLLLFFFLSYAHLPTVVFILFGEKYLYERTM